MSKSLLNNRYINKLEVNRLQANKIKSDNILSNNKEKKSYLFSAILKNASFSIIDNRNAKLEFNTSEQNSVLQFTDRPFTQSNEINMQVFVSLFLSRSSNFFRKYPPNVVLSFNNKQQSFTMTLIESVNINNTTFHLKLLNGEDHILEEVTNNETMNLFVDNATILQDYDKISFKNKWFAVKIFPPQHVLINNLSNTYELQLVSTGNYLIYNINGTEKIAHDYNQYSLDSDNNGNYILSISNRQNLTYLPSEFGNKTIPGTISLNNTTYDIYYYGTNNYKLMNNNTYFSILKFKDNRTMNYYFTKNDYKSINVNTYVLEVDDTTVYVIAFQPNIGFVLNIIEMKLPWVYHLSDRKFINYQLLMGTKIYYYTNNEGNQSFVEIFELGTNFLNFTVLGKFIVKKQFYNTTTTGYMINQGTSEYVITLYDSYPPLWFNEAAAINSAAVGIIISK